MLLHSWCTIDVGLPLKRVCLYYNIYNNNNNNLDICKIFMLPQSAFGSNIVYTFIAMSVERAYSSYRIGRHQNLDIHKAYRPLVYIWMVTFVINILPTIISWLKGDMSNEDWQTRIPSCENKYVSQRQLFRANSTVMDGNERHDHLLIAAAIVLYLLLEVIPVVLMLYVNKRNTRLLNTYTGTGTHQALAIRVMLQRNIVATQVRGMVGNLRSQRICMVLFYNL
jgi:hypothetical protein